MAEKNHLSEDYISLSGFERGVRHFFHTLFWTLGYLKTVLIRKFWYVLIGLVVGLITGYLYYSMKPVYYKTSMVVEFNELTKKTYAEMISQLNKLTGAGAAPRLAKALNISEESATNIFFFESRDMNDAPLRTDTSTRKWQPFKIIVGLRSNSVSDSLDRSVVNYLNNSPMLKKIKQEQRKISLDKLAFINNDLQRLDSLKLEYNRFLSRPNSATFYNNAFNPAELYAQSLELSDNKERLMRWLTIDSAAVSIIDGFKPSSSPQSISFFKSLLIFGSIGLLLGYLVGFMYETKKHVA